MESMGWVSFWQGFFIDPHSIFNVFLIVYVVFLPFVALLSILASFSLGRKLGAIAVVLWLLPGFLSINGINIISADVPDSFIVNDGSMYVGETRSTLYNVFVVFLLGWSITTLFVHFFKIKKGFKESYDHLWYTLGLAVAVIFVVDSNTSYYRVELAESEKNISKILSLTLNQLNYTHSICLKQKDKLISYGISKDFCDWAIKAKFDYFWLSEDKSFTRHFKSKSDLDNLVPRNRLSDISKFNNYICKSDTESSHCNLLSFEFGRFSENSNWPKSRYALAIAPLNKALSIYWEESSKKNKKLKEVENAPNSKWFFYMILGFIAGGKVANSSRNLAGDPKPIFRYWIKYLYTNLYKIFQYFTFLTLSGIWRVKNWSKRNSVQ